MSTLLRISIQIACVAVVFGFICMSILDWNEGAADYAGAAGVILLLSVMAIIYAAFKRF